MFRLDILSDEYLAESLDTMISGMLPHQNYDPTKFGSILTNVLNYVHIEEMEMEYYVVFSILTQLRKLQTQVQGFVPMLTKEILTSTLESNIYDVVRKPNVRMKEWLAREGHPDNLDIETTLETAVQILYSRSVALYNRCLEKAVSSDEAISSIPALMNHFVNNVAENSLSVQRDILQNGYMFGRKYLIGPQGWLEYLSRVNTKLRERISEGNSGTFHLDSLEKVDVILKELKSLFEEIGRYNIPPLDASVPILKHRLVVLTANEGVGKTAFATDNAARLIAGNKKVMYMVGESPKSIIFSRIISSYIFHTRSLFVTPEHISGKLDVPEDIKRVIDLAILEIRQSGNLILQDSFSYYNLYDELVALYEEHHFDAVFIDHSKALKGSVEERKDIEALAIQCREFKRNYPVYVCVLSHLSSIAKELLAKGKKVDGSPTKGSSSLSGEADEIFIMYTNEKLKERGLVAFDVYKIRGAPVNNVIILNLKDSSSSYIFDPKNQQLFDRSTVGADKALEDIMELHEEEDDDDYINLDDDDEY